MNTSPLKRWRPGRQRTVSVSDLSFLVALAVIVLVCMLGGGSSRPDVMSLLYLRPIVVIGITVMIIARGHEVVWSAIRVPLALLGAIALIMTLQLVPLPPSIWAMLPGHGDVAAHLARVGMADTWRPLSMMPELTVNSLVALLPPLAILIGVAGSRRAERTAMVYVIVAIAIVSAVLGIVQLVTGQGYFYQNADSTLPIGLFTNRNHQAALLTISLPALRLLSLVPRKTLSGHLFQQGVCGALGMFFLLVILLTGSRSGIMLAVLGMGIAAFMVPRSQSRLSPGGRGRRPPYRWYRKAVLPLVIVLVPLSIIGLAYVSGRAVSINRFQQVDAVLADQRIAFAPLTWQLARNFFPLGAGFGAFDRVYRLHEPDWALHQTFFNHAHNDLIEAIITGGLPFMIVIGLFIFWMARALYSIIRFSAEVTAKNEAMFLSIVFVSLLIASLFDYHLRTPLLAVVLAYASAAAAMLKNANTLLRRAG